MKISDLLRLSTDNLRRRKGRTALTVIGVVVGTCAIVVMISLGIATNKRTDEMLSTWSDLTQITVLGYSNKKDTPALDDEMVNQFKKIPNVVAATPMYNFESMDASVYAGKNDRYQMQMWNTIGMDVSSIEAMGIELISGSYLSGESYGKNKIPVLLGEETAYQFEDVKKSWRNPDRMRWKELDEQGNVIKQPFFDLNREKLIMKMRYSYDDQNNAKTRDYELVVVGIMKSDYSKQGSTGIIMNIEDMKRIEKEYKKLSKAQGGSSGGNMYYAGGSGGSNKVKGYNQVFVKVNDVDSVNDVESAIKLIGYETNSTTQIREDMQKQVLSGQMMLAGLAAVSLLVAALNIANTMTMAIYERTKEIGIMKVLGCKLNKIRQMFLIESGTIGFLGGVAGCLFSIIISYVLNNFTVWMSAITMWLMSMGITFKEASDSMGGMGGMGGIFGGMGMGGEGVLSIVPWWLCIAALIFATVVGLLSGIAPANRAVKISALEAIRHE